MADYDEAERKRLEAEGKTAYGTSYPIVNCDDLHHAIEAYGRAPEEHRAELRRYIARRKIELGCPGVNLPETWRLERGAS